MLKLKDGKVMEEIGLDEGVAALTQLELPRPRVIGRPPFARAAAAASRRGDQGGGSRENGGKFCSHRLYLDELQPA